MGPEEVKASVTRIEMAEYLSAREWWRNAQNTLGFTLVLWGVFALILYLRADVEANIEVHRALTGFFTWITAHPTVSDFGTYSPSETPVPCRCSCRNSLEMDDPTVCDARTSTEVLDVMARLPPQVTEELVNADGAQLAGTFSQTRVTIDTVSNAEEAFMWVQHGVLPELFHPTGGRGPPEEGMVFRRSLAVGGFRLRQTRFKALPECEISSKIAHFYPITCRDDAETDDAAYGPGGGAFSSSTTADDKPVYDAHFDLSRGGLNMALHEAEMLRNNSWLSEVTHTLDLEAVFLSAEARVFARVRASFDFGSSGRVDSTLRVNTIPAMGAKLAGAAYMPEIIWLILISWLFIEAAVKAIRLTVDYCRSEDEDREAVKVQVWAYLLNLWTWLDWVAIFLGMAIAIYWGQVIVACTQLSTDAAEVPRIPIYEFDREGSETMTGLVNGVNRTVSRDAYQTAWVKVLDDAEVAVSMKRGHMICLFWYTSILTVRFLKGFLGQQKLAIFQVAIANSFWDVTHFLLIFVPIFFNFALGGVALFGTELKTWNSFGNAVSSCIRMLLGGYEFDAMYDVAPVSATIWYWLYLSSMVFVLLNLLTAIMIEHYSALRTMVGPTPTIINDMWSGWSDFKFRCEWRKDQYDEGLYARMVQNPLDSEEDTVWATGKPLGLSMMELAELPPWVKAAADHNSIGLKLARRRLEAQSVMSMATEGNPAGQYTASLEMRRAGVDATTAEYLIEECEKYVNADESWKTMIALNQVRAFVTLLKRHRKELAEHCVNLEEGVAEDCAAISRCMDRMEGSIRETLAGFSELRSRGAETLAPPRPGHNAAALRALAKTAAFAEEEEYQYDEGGYEEGVYEEGGNAGGPGGYQMLVNGGADDIPPPALLN